MSRKSVSKIKKKKGQSFFFAESGPADINSLLEVFSNEFNLKKNLEVIMSSSKSELEAFSVDFEHTIYKITIEPVVSLKVDPRTVIVKRL